MDDLVCVLLIHAPQISVKSEQQQIIYPLPIDRYILKIRRFFNFSTRIGY